MIDEQMTVLDAVRRFPGISETLTDLGIAKEDKPLGEVLAEKNLDAESILDLLNRRASNLDDLVTTIMRKFHYAESDLLDELDTRLQTILKVHYDAHGPEIAEIYLNFLLLKAELKHHFARQERVIFPQLLDGALATDTAKVSGEERIKAQVDSLRELTRDFNPPADACPTYQLTYQGLRNLSESIENHLNLENTL